MLDAIGWLLSLPVCAAVSIVVTLVRTLITYWAWIASLVVVVHGTAAAVRQLPDGRWPR
jgi:hypothetical protein